MRKTMSVVIAWTFLTGCTPNQQVERSVLSLEKEERLSSSELLLSKDSSHYFQDLKMVDDYFGLLDKDNDTALYIYKQGGYQFPVFTLSRGTGKHQIENASFLQEVRPASENGFTLMDNNFRKKQVKLVNGRWKTQSNLLSNAIIHSHQLNETEKELYGVPYLHVQAYPFYYCNPEEGYYWVGADTAIAKVLTYSNPDAYACSLCVNEKKDKVVSAYRFTNYISFYTLKGDLLKTIRIGDSPIYPIYQYTGVLDMVNTTKCFIDICGTERYVYCLYSGSADYLAPPYLIAFKWNGEHHKTWLLDQNIRAMDIFGDKCLIGIRTGRNKEQRVYRYML